MIWDFNLIYEKHGSGHTENKSHNPASKARRQRSAARRPAKKDRNVMKSSHGVFASVDDLMQGIRNPN